MGHPSMAAYEIVVMCLTTESEEDRTRFIRGSLEECESEHERVQLLMGAAMGLAGVVDDVRRNLPESGRFLDAVREMHVRRTLGH